MQVPQAQAIAILLIATKSASSVASPKLRKGRGLLPKTLKISVLPTKNGNICEPVFQTKIQNGKKLRI